MNKQPFVRQVMLLAGLAAVYTVAGKLGLRLGFLYPSASPVWAPTGLSLAAILLFGPSVWPSLFLGAFLVNLTTAGSTITSLGVACGNTLEALVGAAFVRHWANGPHAFGRGRDVVRFAFAVLAAGTLSATCGVTSLALGRYAAWNEYGAMWLTWWLGNVAGALLVVPLLLLWAADWRVRWRGVQLIEIGALLVTLVLISLVAFGRVGTLEPGTHTLGFLCMPVLIWAALRFGPRETATGLAFVAAIAVAQTLRSGPSGSADRNESLILLQTFMAVTAVTLLVLAAVVAERRRGEERLRELATTDPLTGLANYRQLLVVLEAELRRSQRTDRQFSLLFFDLDRLKAINDRHGHLTGSRALCRLADAIQLSCRTIDTAARFGGDEFAVILPEADEAEALQVAGRVRQRLAADGEMPSVSASVGSAVHPSGGRTVEQLLATADHALYEMKKARPKRPTPR